MKIFLITCCLAAVFLGSAARAAESTPYELKSVGIVDKPGSQISLDLQFTDEEGKKVPLKNFFDGVHPVILSLAYYECPNLCGILLNGEVSGLRNLAWTSGNEFQVVNVSINPKETSALAQEKKSSLIKAYGRTGAENGWHLLVGEEANIQKLAKEVGFGYYYDKDEKQYAHAAGIFVLSPDGKLSRTLYGIEFPGKDLRLALTEASQGKIGTVVDRLLLFCYRYDPKSKKYDLYATNLMRAGGVAIVLFLGFLIFKLKRKIEV